MYNRSQRERVSIVESAKAGGLGYLADIENGKVKLRQSLWDFSEKDIRVSNTDMQLEVSVRNYVKILSQLHNKFGASFQLDNPSLVNLAYSKTNAKGEVIFDDDVIHQTERSYYSKIRYRMSSVNLFQLPQNCLSGVENFFVRSGVLYVGYQLDIQVDSTKVDVSLRKKYLGSGSFDLFSLLQMLHVEMSVEAVKNILKGCTIESIAIQVSHKTVGGYELPPSLPSIFALNGAEGLLALMKMLDTLSNDFHDKLPDLNERELYIEPTSTEHLPYKWQMCSESVIPPLEVVKTLPKPKIEARTLDTLAMHVDARFDEREKEIIRSGMFGKIDLAVLFNAINISFSITLKGIELVSNKKKVLVLGLTGAGKDVCAAYMLGYPLCEKQVRRKLVIDYCENTLDEDRPVISHNLKANTRGSRLYDNDLDEHFSYINTPGLEDIRGPEADMANAMTVAAATKKYRPDAVVFILNPEDIDSNHATRFFKSLRNLRKMLPNKDAWSSIFFVINKRIDDINIDAGLPYTSREKRDSLIENIEDSIKDLEEQWYDLIPERLKIFFNKIAKVWSPFAGGENAVSEEEKRKFQSGKLVDLSDQIDILVALLARSKNFIVADVLDGGHEYTVANYRDEKPSREQIKNRTIVLYITERETGLEEREYDLMYVIKDTYGNIHEGQWVDEGHTDSKEYLRVKEIIVNKKELMPVHIYFILYTFEKRRLVELSTRDALHVTLHDRHRSSLKTSALMPELLYEDNIPQLQLKFETIINGIISYFYAGQINQAKYQNEIEKKREKLGEMDQGSELACYKNLENWLQCHEVKVKKKRDELSDKQNQKENVDQQIEELTTPESQVCSTPMYYTSLAPHSKILPRSLRVPFGFFAAKYSFEYKDEGKNRKKLPYLEARTKPQQGKFTEDSANDPSKAIYKARYLPGRWGYPEDTRATVEIYVSTCIHPDTLNLLQGSRNQSKTLAEQINALHIEIRVLEAEKFNGQSVLERREQEKNKLIREIEELQQRLDDIHADMIAYSPFYYNIAEMLPWLPEFRLDLALLRKKFNTFLNFDFSPFLHAQASEVAHDDLSSLLANDITDDIFDTHFTFDQHIFRLKNAINLMLHADIQQENIQYNFNRLAFCAAFLTSYQKYNLSDTESRDCFALEIEFFKKPLTWQFFNAWYERNATFDRDFFINSAVMPRVFYDNHHQENSYPAWPAYHGSIQGILLLVQVILNFLKLWDSSRVFYGTDSNLSEQFSYRISKQSFFEPTGYKIQERYSQHQLLR